MTEAERLSEIAGHLGAAISQSLADVDDRIILMHMHDAYNLAAGERHRRYAEHFAAMPRWVSA